MKPLLVYVDMDDTLCDFRGAHAAALKKNPAIQYPQSQMDFFRSLKPLEEAIEAMQWMLEHEQLDPHILTAPSVMNPLCYTEKRLWVADHLGEAWLDRLHISPRKDLFQGDILIDDNATGKGQDTFEGILIHFGMQGTKDWFQVARLLKNVLLSEKPVYTLDEMLGQTPKANIELDDEDRAWLRVETDEEKEN